MCPAGGCDYRSRKSYKPDVCVSGRLCVGYVRPVWIFLRMRVCCLLCLALVALAVVFLKQPSEVLVFPASRFKIKDLILDAHPQVIQ